MQAHCWKTQGPGGKWHREDWTTETLNAFFTSAFTSRTCFQESQVPKSNWKA